MSHYLAADLGAESGRVMLGALHHGKLSLEELHRFANTPVRLPTGLYWDSLHLFHEIVHGLTVAGRDRKLSITGIGVDTWGVDFGLIDRGGALIDCPRCYRDERTNGVPEKLFDTVARDEVFALTGIQFMQFNSLYQLYAMRLDDAPALHAAARLLFMPDLLNFWLTGRQVSDRTIASTSQFYNPTTREFTHAMLERLGIPSRIMPDIVEPGTRLGPLLPHLAEAAKLTGAAVFTTGGHDTASAVAAVPARGGGWCYISSGTWSLMGVEIDEPVINDRSLALNFTNEIGAGGKIRLLKNIAGLWLLQECRRDWAADGNEYSYDELTRLAADAGPAASLIDVDAFLHPGRMPRQIADWCCANNRQAPQTAGQFARTILESLAHRYHQVLKNLEELTGAPITVIHIVGGGSKNRLLNQLVADATGRTVIAGPAEATALGNILIQSIGAGETRDLAHAREIVTASCTPETFRPR